MCQLEIVGIYSPYENEKLSEEKFAPFITAAITKSNLPFLDDLPAPPIPDIANIMARSPQTTPPGGSWLVIVLGAALAILFLYLYFNSRYKCIRPKPKPELQPTSHKDVAAIEMTQLFPKLPTNDQETEA